MIEILEAAEQKKKAKGGKSCKFKYARIVS
jgi:hypothetical protein